MTKKIYVGTSAKAAGGLEALLAAIVGAAGIEPAEILKVEEVPDRAFLFLTVEEAVTEKVLAVASLKKADGSAIRIAPADERKKPAAAAKTITLTPGERRPQAARPQARAQPAPRPTVARPTVRAMVPRPAVASVTASEIVALLATTVMYAFKAYAAVPTVWWTKERRAKLAALLKVPAAAEVAALAVIHQFKAVSAWWKLNGETVSPTATATDGLAAFKTYVESNLAYVKNALEAEAAYGLLSGVVNYPGGQVANEVGVVEANPHWESDLDALWALVQEPVAREMCALLVESALESQLADMRELARLRMSVEKTKGRCFDRAFDTGKAARVFAEELKTARSGKRPQTPSFFPPIEEPRAQKTEQKPAAMATMEEALKAKGQNVPNVKTAESAEDTLH